MSIKPSVPSEEPAPAVLKVVLDTNQFVSSLLVKQGLPARLLQAWRKGAFALVTSEAILQEIQRVLSYPRIRKKYNIHPKDIEALLELLEREAVVTSDSLRLNVIKED